MARIGVLLLDVVTDRGSTAGRCFDDMLYLGLHVVLDDLAEPYEFCSSSTLKDYEYALVSLTSSMDVENLVNTLEGLNKGKCKIIVGGNGCINIRAYSDLIDIAVFGRAEGQINEILAGEDFPNVWRRERDPEVRGTYEVRQAERPTEREETIGCPNKCYFCQYTWTRRSTSDRYTHGGDLYIDEDDFKSLKITKSGRYTTAFDGCSERTRNAVGKTWVKVSDIENKMSAIYECETILRPVNLKIFNIVGYPWESPATWREDMAAEGEMWRKIDRGRGLRRIVLMYYFTPFSPEPLTPMQYSKSQPRINWHTEIGHGKCVPIWNGVDINAFTLPQINSGLTLAKRVLINRCREQDRKGVRSLLRNKQLRALPASLAVKAIFDSRIIDSGLFEEIEPGSAGFDYLKTYLDPCKMHGLAEKRFAHGI